MTQRQKCFHCGEKEGILVRLTPRENNNKTVCMECLWARHPKTALEMLEFILDKEQAETQAGIIGVWGNEVES